MWPWWLYIVSFFALAGGFAILIFILMLSLIWIDMLIEKFKSLGYKRDAKKHNKKALKLRLARDTWQGLPLPQGKSGSLVLTELLLIQYPYSFRQIEKIMLDRAKDLGVDISIERDIMSYDYVVTWRKHKKEKKRNGR